jgi:HK97 family phage portal protein
VGLAASIRASLRSAFRPGAVVGASPVSPAGFVPIVREPYTGAWQQNAEQVGAETALSNPTVFRCVSLIASDIRKLPLRLVALDANGIWYETTSPAFSPVLRKPNAYQTTGQYLEAWIFSRLLTGNAYSLKERDDRGVVTGLHVLDPARVKVLVAPDGAVYYELQTNDLAGLPADGGALVAPAREIIHDRWNCAFHPLQGVSPLYAGGGAARQALEMQAASTEFFSLGGRPSGMLVPATNIDQKTIDRIAATWHSLGPGRTAILGSAMKYEQVTTSAAESQWAEQIAWSAKTIATVFGVPYSKIDATVQPPYANSEASNLQYLSECLQIHITDIEIALDQGLELPAPYGTEFNLDALGWMDTATATRAAHDAIAAGAMSPNEARRKYFDLGPVPGGDTPYLQAQYYSLEALERRDLAHPATPAETPPRAPAPAEVP